MADIFISYSRVDQPLVFDLVRLLEEQNLTVWWDRNLVGGTKFHRDLLNRLEALEPLGQGPAYPERQTFLKRIQQLSGATTA